MTHTAALAVVAAADLTPGDVVHTLADDGTWERRYMLLTPRDESGRAMIDTNGLIVPFNEPYYVVMHEVIQLAWRNLEIWAVLNRPTMTLEQQRKALAAAFDAVTPEAVAESKEKWGKDWANREWQKVKKGA